MVKEIKWLMRWHAEVKIMRTVVGLGNDDEEWRNGEF